MFTIKTLLKQESSRHKENDTDGDQPTTSTQPPCSDFMTTSSLVTCKCDGVNVTILPVNDWEPMGGYVALYKQSSTQPADAQQL